MIQKILFTKIFNDNTLNYLSNLYRIDIRYLPTLEIKLEKPELIQKRIDGSISGFIVTSQNAVKAINCLDIDGYFYVVGEKTSELLQDQKRKVIATFDCAKDLSNYLISTPFKKWNFLCGSTRRDELIDLLHQDNHYVNEVISYHVKPIEYKLTEIFDAYSFFSPLSFFSFAKNNHIPPNSFIFSIGNTTTEAIKKIYPNYNIITCKRPILKEMIENIKKTIHDKK